MGPPASRRSASTPVRLREVQMERAFNTGPARDAIHSSGHCLATASPGASTCRGSCSRSVEATQSQPARPRNAPMTLDTLVMLYEQSRDMEETSSMRLLTEPE